VIGKTSPIPDDGTGMPQRYNKKDCSSSLRHSESGMVDSVLLTTGADGQRFVKMRVRALGIMLGMLLLLQCCGSGCRGAA
jgi:DNA-directed RNA polymerase II subunit RPB2